VTRKFHLEGKCATQALVRLNWLCMRTSKPARGHTRAIRLLRVAAGARAGRKSTDRSVCATRRPRVGVSGSTI